MLADWGYKGSIGARVLQRVVQGDCCHPRAGLLGWPTRGRCLIHPSQSTLRPPPPGQTGWPAMVVMS